MILYCLHDVKAETWSFPQTTNNPATAAREFELLKRRPEFPAADVEVVQVGTFDPVKGEIVPGYVTLIPVVESNDEV